MTLSKAHIVEELFAENLFTKKDSAQVIDTLFELINSPCKMMKTFLSAGSGNFQ